MTENKQDSRFRCSVQTGSLVDIVQKQDQKSGRKTRGIISEILTNPSYHPHGIKVRLRDGKVGRVSGIIEPERNDPGVNCTIPVQKRIINNLDQRTAVPGVRSDFSP